MSEEIKWESSVNQLSTNKYIIDGTKIDDQVDNEFERTGRRNLLNGNAKGTAEHGYLDPVPLWNKIGQIYSSLVSGGYLSARYDSIYQNRHNMDYTNDCTPADEEEEDSFSFDFLDLNGDGYIGVDDVTIILNYISNALFQDEVKIEDIFDKSDKNDLSVTDINLPVNAAFMDFSIFDNNSGMSIDEALKATYPIDRVSNIVTYEGKAKCLTHEISDFRVDDGTSYKGKTFYLPLYTNSGEYQNDNTDDNNDVFRDKIRKIIKYFGKDNLNVDTASFILQIIASYKNTEGVVQSAVPVAIFDEDAAATEEKSHYLNLLMPRYARRVEVEDLDENFWVIGQVLDGVVSALWKRDGIVDILKQIVNQINILIQKVENIENYFGMSNQVALSFNGPKYASIVRQFNLERLNVNVASDNLGGRTISGFLNPAIDRNNENKIYKSFSDYCKARADAGTTSPIPVGYLFYGKAPADSDTLGLDATGTVDCSLNDIMTFLYNSSSDSSFKDKSKTFLEKVTDPYIPDSCNILIYNVKDYAIQKEDDNTYYLVSKKPEAFDTKIRFINGEKAENNNKVTTKWIKRDCALVNSNLLFNGEVILISLGKHVPNGQDMFSNITSTTIQFKEDENNDYTSNLKLHHVFVENIDYLASSINFTAKEAFPAVTETEDKSSVTKISPTAGGFIAQYFKPKQYSYFDSKYAKAVYQPRLTLQCSDTNEEKVYSSVLYDIEGNQIFNYKIYSLIDDRLMSAICSSTFATTTNDIAHLFDQASFTVGSADSKRTALKLENGSTENGYDSVQNLKVVSKNLTQLKTSGSGPNKDTFITEIKKLMNGTEGEFKNYQETLNKICKKISTMYSNVGAFGFIQGTTYRGNTTPVLTGLSFEVPRNDIHRSIDEMLILPIYNQFDKNDLHIQIVESDQDKYWLDWTNTIHSNNNFGLYNTLTCYAYNPNKKNLIPIQQTIEGQLCGYLFFFVNNASDDEATQGGANCWSVHNLTLYGTSMGSAGSAYKTIKDSTDIDTTYLETINNQIKVGGYVN